MTITEKYCRFEELGKEWYYNMQEKIFQESLRSTLKNYCSQQKEIQATSKKEETAKQKPNLTSPSCQVSCPKKSSSPDWKASFTVEERKFLAFLLNSVPAIGESIEEQHATLWIKYFGITKIKVALQVYWQQGDKAKKDSEIPKPTLQNQ